MPLNSRLTRPTPNDAPVTPSPAADQPTTSPRRRGLTPAAAGSTTSEVGPRTDTLDDQEGLESHVPPIEADEDDEASADRGDAGGTAPDPGQAEETPPPIKTGRPVGSKDRKSRVPRPVALPDDAADSTDPAVLQKVLNNLNAEAKALKTQFEADLDALHAQFEPKRKEIRAQYEAVSKKLAAHLF